MTGRICVVGLGYIGLPTAAVFADAGLEVAGADTDPAVVAAVNAGRPHIAEPGLALLAGRAVAAGRLGAAPAPVPAECFIIAVPTPLGPGNTPDLRHVEAAAAAIAPHLAPGNLVVLESTSPVGTTERLAALLAAARPDLGFPAGHGADADIRLAYCPERVLPGRILEEVVANDRVIGGLTPACAAAAARLYARVVRGRCHLTDARTAELSKLAENAFRDVNIAFANELAAVAGRLGIEARALIRLANRHPRVDILSPGPGVGGHCIAVDPWFIAASAPEETRLIRTARAVNAARPARVADQALALAAGLARPVFGCFGLAYKADVGDLRESPAVEVTRRLVEAGRGPVLAVEPHIEALPAELAGAEPAGLDDALARCDVAVLLVDHGVFRDVDPGLLAGRRLLDTRGIWSGPEFRPSIPAEAPSRSSLALLPAAPEVAGRHPAPC